MMDLPTGTVKLLYHYPIKGLSPQPLTGVSLQPHRGFPADRIFALARADGAFDPAVPDAPLPKSNFHVLMRDQRLAGLSSHLDPDTRHLTIRSRDRLALECDLSTEAGAAALSDLVSSLLELPAERHPTIAHAEPHAFTDVEPRLVSLINLATVADFAGRIGRDVDPLRFRANIYFEGWPAQAELSLAPGTVFTVGGVTLRLDSQTGRCAATQVNPRTAERDLPVPRLLVEQYGHANMGFYAEPVSAGHIAVGDPVAILGGKA